jgi:DNA-binding PucR family transcriptional regulator
VVWCAACMTQLLIFSDEELLLRFATGLLKPLDDLNAVQKERLAETMLAWLANWGNATAAAQSLQVHPQTVRYRLRQINELFADDLQDPDKRFALEMALRARQVLRARTSLILSIYAGCQNI